MNIKTDIIKEYIASTICDSITDFEIDADKIVDTKATMALAEIQKILHRDELDDFEMIDEIVQVFYKYNLDAGVCHDF